MADNVVANHRVGQMTGRNNERVGQIIRLK